MHFDLVDLRLMVRVAEANSLTRGAEAAHMSVPAASTRIKNIEESMGTKLLYRTSQGVTDTYFGRHEYLLLRPNGAIRIKEKRSILKMGALRPHGKLSIIV